MGFKDWLIFLRWPNLALVALTQLIIWRVELVPYITYNLYDEPALSNTAFLLLCLCTVLVTAAGNVVNDIHDRHLDTINKPNKVFVGTKVSLSQSWAVYWLLNSTGLTIAIYLADQQNAWMYLPLFPFFTWLLWAYSRYWKGSILFGNIVISLAVGFVAYIPLLAEWEHLGSLSQNKNIFLLFYGFMAFLSNLLREIIKDAQDEKGDKNHGKKTLATHYGLGASLQGSRIILFALWVAILAFCLVLQAYLALIILLPLLILLSLELSRPLKKLNWKKLSTLVKVLMLIGIVFLAFLA